MLFRSSQSDPLSSLTVVGKDVKNKKDLPIHEAIKAAYQSKKSKTASDPAPVAPEKKVTSQHIKTDHPMLRKPLSQFRERIPEISRRIPQTDSPFASMPSPGVKRPPVSRKLSPEGIPEHMPQAHRENSIGGYQDSGI